MRILVVRLGAMGDVIHALPAVASLKRIPRAHIAWALEPKWAALLEGNPAVDTILPLNRRDWSSVRSAWSRLRKGKYDVAVDFQGLMKSALVAWASGANQVVGYANTREVAAGVFYSKRVVTEAMHIVDQHLDLALASGAPGRTVEFAIPRGAPEGELPTGEFVLASPLAGWKSKQWPLEYYSELAKEVKLVINGAPTARAELEQIRGAHLHLSGLPGLIDATRRASAVVGVDSGPLHLAAALGKRGVAIFGPTDPARNGPYGGTLRVLRAEGTETTYQRATSIADSMRAITPAQVREALP